MLRAAASVEAHLLRTSRPSSGVVTQKRFKPIDPLKHTSGKVVITGINRQCQPWEVRNDYDTIKGHFGLVVKRGGCLTPKQLDNALLAIKTYINPKQFQIEVRDNFRLWPTVGKPRGVRMGGGQGEIKNYVFRLRAGTVLFDVSTKLPHRLNNRFIKLFFLPGQHLL
eukprot:Sspe_Gene.84197::Locus_55263_Transcript_1_1_Confidence_1.000_Length_549::g.84197::m.84197/K02878/RP-L16, MRPL16, rplP; large subunit ribosomal protein L16